MAHHDVQDSYAYRNELDEAMQHPIMQQIVNNPDIVLGDIANVSENMSNVAQGNDYSDCYFGANEVQNFGENRNEKVKVEYIKNDYLDTFDVNLYSSEQQFDEPPSSYLPYDIQWSFEEHFQSMNLDTTVSDSSIKPKHSNDRKKKSRNAKPCFNASVAGYPETESLFENVEHTESFYTDSPGLLTPSSGVNSPNPSYSELQTASPFQNYLEGDYSPQSMTSGEESSFLSPSPSYSSNLSPWPCSPLSEVPSQVSTSTKRRGRPRTISTASATSFVEFGTHTRAPRQCLKTLSEGQRKDRVRGQNNDASQRYRERKGKKRQILEGEILELESEVNLRTNKVQSLQRKTDVVRGSLERMGLTIVNGEEPMQIWS